MKIQEIQQQAIDSAREYYIYLDRHNKGIIKIAVRSISVKNEMISMALEKKIQMIDTIEFLIRGKKYHNQLINIISFNEKSRKLTIKPEKEIFDLIAGLDPKEILIISDLKFLVKRVEEWYRENGNKVHLPSNLPSVKNLEYISDVISLSDEQKQAVRGALTNSFSYIWGAPGTGKTRVVLSNCIWNYIKNKQKVLLLAPTNNAVEQSLRGLIETLDLKGIDRSKIFRLGIPTSEFALEYPDICESKGPEKDNENLIKEIKEIENAKSYFISRNNYEDALSKITAIEESFKKYEDEKEKKDKKIETSYQEYENFERNLKNIEFEIDNCKEKIKIFERNNNNFVNKIINRLSNTNSNDYLETLNGYYKELDELNLKEKNLFTEFNDVKNKGTKNNSDLFIQAFHKAKNSLCELLEFDKKLYLLSNSINDENYKEIFDDIKINLSTILENLVQDESLYRDYIYKSNEELDQEIEDLNNRLARQGNNIAKANNALVLACTLDTFISRVIYEKDVVLSTDSEQVKFIPKHVFIDEAGYTSLIKGIIPFAIKVPVTYLGDHMQLPPVCEMHDEKNKYSDIIQNFWQMSTLAAEELFSLESKDFHMFGRSKTEPKFNYLKRFDLCKSFRFGERLARILAENIYNIDFKGNPDIGMELIVVDVKYKKDKEKRTNIAEAEAINVLINKNMIDDYAILTPYRNQVSLVKEKISQTDIEDRVMTVHGSQGREWHTVIFSVVDTFEKWFTDSERVLTEGKKIINTAISRAKQRLIVVCDRSYWDNFEEQLIYKIISVSDNYSTDQLKNIPLSDQFDLNFSNDAIIEDTCETCKLQKNNTCFGQSKICEYYIGIPIISKEEKANWPKHGDALNIKFNDFRK